MEKEIAYLIRGKNGEYAIGTKVCRSRTGALNSLNSFVHGVIAQKINADYRMDEAMGSLEYLYKWYFNKKDSPMGDWDTLVPFLKTTQLNLGKITEQDYDRFMKIVNDAFDYWEVEAVEQNV